MRINKYTPVPVLVRNDIAACLISFSEDKVCVSDNPIIICKNTRIYYLGYIKVSSHYGKYAYFIYPEVKNCVICIPQDSYFYSCISNDNNDSLDRLLTEEIKDCADGWNRFDEVVLKAYFND